MTKNNRTKVFFLIITVILLVASLPLTAMADSPKAENNTGSNNTEAITAIEIEETPEAQEARIYKKEVLTLVNVERAKVGVAPLQTLEELDQLAQIRAEEIKVSFSHTRPNGVRWTSIFENSSLTYKRAGENLAYGFNRPSDLINAWMNSPSHKANILKPDFEHLGIGFYKDNNGRIHASQLFFKAMPGA